MRGMARRHVGMTGTRFDTVPAQSHLYIVRGAG
jgi:hypothetical protein